VTELQDGKWSLETGKLMEQPEKMAERRIAELLKRHSVQQTAKRWSILKRQRRPATIIANIAKTD